MDPSSPTDAAHGTQLRRQEVIADLSQQALETDDLEGLRRDAVRAVAETLAVEYAAVFEVPPSTDGAVLEAGVGWDAETVEPTVPTEPGSQPGEALRDGEPVIVDDLSDDDRITASQLIADPDIESGVSVRLGSSDEPLGVLGAYATERGAFTEADADFVGRVAEILSVAIEQERERGDLEEVYGRISDAVFALDEEWRFTYINERAQELINPDERLLLGTRIWDEFPEALERAFKPKYERAMNEGETIAFEEYYPEPLESWFEVRAYPSETGLSVYFRDITERKERERERELFRTLLDQSTDSVLVVDPESGQYLDVNETACQRRGYSREELLSLSVPDIETEIADRAEWRAFVDELRTSGTITFDGRHRRRDGTTYPVEVNVSHVELDREYVLAIARDVTERRERERELQRTERRFEAIFEDPNILVGLLEPDGTVVDINRTAMEYVDADLEEVAGKPFWETPWWDGSETSEADIRGWIDRAAAGEYVDFEADLVRPDGEQYTVNGVFRPVTNDDGTVVSIIVSDRDVTEQVERERQLEESERRYRTLVEQFPNGAVALVDEDLRYQTVGGDPVDGTEVTTADLEGEPIEDILPSALVDELVPRYEAALDGETSAFELTSGSSVYNVQTVPVRDDDGDVFAALGMSQDITERREYERRLEESEQRYRTIAEHVPNGLVTLFDRDFEYTLAAGQGFDRIPVEPADLEGRAFSDVWPEETVDELRPAFQTALDGAERSVEIEYAGHEWLFHAVPITDERGEVFAGMTMAQDITERKERERYLRDAKSQLEAATEAGAVGTWELNVQNDEMFVGPSFAQTFDIDPDVAQRGVSLDRFVDAIHEDDRERVVAEIEDAVEACGEYESEYRVWNADGELRWVVARGRVECDDDGEALTFPGALTDITARKRAELERRRNQEQLETLFEILPAGVVVADADGRLIEANDTAKEIWGGDVFDADSIAEYEQYAMWWADSGEPVAPEETTMSRVLDGEEVRDPNVFEIEAEDGDRRIIRVEGMPVRNADGNVTRGVITITDITERKARERKLRERERRLEESERRYRTLVENFPEGAVGLFDENLEYTVVGGQLLDELGIGPDERIGHSVGDLHSSELVDEIEPYFAAALEGESNSFELERYDRYLYAHTLPVRNGDGEIFAGMVVVQDVTERREYQRKLEESNERLEQFAYAASHDLQEPLRMVTSYLKLLESRYGDAFDDDGEEFLDYAVDGAERMRQMIDALLEYSRIETRGDPFEPTDLNAVVDDVLADLQFQVEETTAEIAIEDLPRVEADANQLRQVFQNLLGNAITYSGDEPPRIHVSADRRDGEHVISVADEGIGIDPDDQERVFTIFDRLHSREEYDGMGIGLALCERIVERHGGEIWVESEPGDGSTFSFTLPVSPDGEN
ncbi:PAS domain-containing protein [Natrinema sp. 1APR25-10V2]|uniref:PAS domain-containing protein n=1 Tax=Natrinema sp. 1APR25-10V2 TaxID=2951081 RepID=UPI0028756D6C|nr:PAS domain-containing protein [Natrinema sp. 1APR25-10V2]MDS0475883.1 PAS domain S-box protein [Natrinema sp. 1APR25-10V2]